METYLQEVFYRFHPLVMDLAGSFVQSEKE